MDLEYEYGIWWDPLMVIPEVGDKTSPQFSMVSMDAFVFSQIYPKEIWHTLW